MSVLVSKYVPSAHGTVNVMNDVRVVGNLLNVACSIYVWHSMCIQTEKHVIIFRNKYVSGCGSISLSVVNIFE